MRIYIPSRGRPKLQRTLSFIPESWKKKTSIVVYQDEADEYSKNIDSDSVSILVCHPPKTGISFKRQWIIEHHAKTFKNDPYLVFMDDDLFFYKRREEKPTNAVNATPEDVGRLLDTIELLLRYFPHVGVLGREGANFNSENQFLFASRMMRVLAYDVRALKQSGARFDRLKVMEDFDVTLHLLERGYKNCVICFFWQGHLASNSKGGCSEFRDESLNVECSKQLAKLHPGIVSLVENKRKVAWGGGDIPNVRIKWVQAYKNRKFLRSPIPMIRYPRV